MNAIQRIARIGLATAVVLAATAGAAAAAWLVTTDGTKVETRGPWQVKGGLVVFTSADGVLSSLRLSACDLEASAAATEAAQRAPIEPSVPAPAPRGPVLVLTDADVGHVRPAAPADAPRESDQAEPDAAPGVVVSEWEPRDEDDGVSIAGMLRNDGKGVAGNVRLVAIFRDAEGDPIESRSATLSTSTLRPGQKARFTVPPFGLFAYSTIDFDIQHFEILTGGPGGEAAAGGS